MAFMWHYVSALLEWKATMADLLPAGLVAATHFEEAVHLPHNSTPVQEQRSATL